MVTEAALVEAILFLETEPVEVEKLIRLSQLNKEVVLESLNFLREKYESQTSGIELAQTSTGFYLVPKPELAESLKEHYGKKPDDKLSKAALETLSIIAYAQPITKSEVESIRGVSCAAVLKQLQDKEVIEEVGRKETVGRPVQFGTTKKFLQLFRLNSIADLPRLEGAERDRFELKEP